MGQDSRSAVKQHPATSTKPANPYNGPIGTVVPRQPAFIGPVKPKVIADQPIPKKDIVPPAKHSTLPAVVPLPDQRTKLTFTLKKPGTVQNSGSKLVKPASSTNASAQKEQKQPDIKPPVLSSATPSKLQLQGLVKPKATVSATPSKGFTGLVPYSGEDSNSSSDSENYDALAEQLSKLPGQSSNGSSSSNKRASVPNGAVKVKTEGERKAMVSPTHSGMKPPSHAVSHLDAGATSKKRSLANGTDLTVLRKPDSPLKLTITTNGNAQRLKATGNWRVSDAESQVSPSPASDSSMHSNHSNMSTNSTSDWTVVEKRDAPSTPQKVKEEAATYGWSITPKKLELMRSFSDPGEVNKPHNGKWDPSERKPIKEAEDLQGSNVRTSDWLHNKHISHQTESATPFGFNVKEVKPLKDSNVPRDLNDAFLKKESDIERKEDEKSKENHYMSMYSKDGNVCGDETSKDVENESPSKKKKKHKKHKQDADSEAAESIKCEEKAVSAESEKAKSPDVGEGDSGYYSIKSKNNNSDLEEGDDGEDDGELRKPKKHKHKKKKKKREHDKHSDANVDEDERTCNTQYNEGEEYGPVLPESIKDEQRKDDEEYGPKLPGGLNKQPHDKKSHSFTSPDHRHKSESEHRLKSPEHKNRHRSDRFRSPEYDGRSGHKFAHGQDHRNRHRSDDRHYVRSPEYDRHYRSPNYDRNRVRSPDYEHRYKKYRSGDNDNPKHRPYDRHRHSSDESDRYYSKFSTNRTSDDEDHSYAKRIKDKKRKRKHRDRDDYTRDDYSDRDWDSYRDDHRREKGDGFARLGSPNKKRKSLNGDSWDDNSGSKGYREERRKSDGKPRHEGEC